MDTLKVERLICKQTNTKKFGVPLEKTEFPGKNVDCSKKHWEEHTFNFKKYFANHGDSCLFQNSKTSEFCFPIWKKNLAYFDVRGFKPAASAFCFQIL